MEAGEPVCAVSAFPGKSSLLAVGCESGKIIVKDVDSEKDTYSCENPDAIIIIRTVEENTFYAATEEEIWFYDTRQAGPQKSVFKAPSTIYDFSVTKDSIAVATVSNDIFLKDKGSSFRTLKKPKSAGILPAVCSSLVFSGDGLVAGYMDTSVGKWQLSKGGIFEVFEAVAVQNMNPPVVHSVDVFGEYTIVGRQTSLSVYKNGKVVADDLFEHEGSVQAVCAAKCFDGRPFSVSGAADGTLMVFDLEKLTPLDCITCDNEKIECLTSNSSFLAVADTSDNGSLGVFTADDFGKEEEEEK